MTETILTKIIPPSYVIFNNNGVINAQNGVTGNIDYSDTVASTVIQNTINGLPTTGGQIFIKAGTYLIDSTIIIPCPLTMVGESKGGTILLVNKDNIDCISIYPPSNIWETSGVSIRDLVIDGHGICRYGLIFDGGLDISFSARYVTGCYFENITIKNCVQFGVYENSNWGNTYISCKIMSNGISSATTGGVCIFCNVATFIGCRIDWNGTGVIFRTGSGNGFYNCVIEGENYYGVYAYSTPLYNFYPCRNILDSCWFEDNNQSLTANIRDIYITGINGWSPYNNIGWWDIRSGESYGTNVDYSVYIDVGSSYSAISNFRNISKTIMILADHAKIYNCQTIDKNSLLSSNSGTSVGTGSQQAIPHKLTFTPTPQQIALFLGGSGAAPYHRTVPDGKNIYIVAPRNVRWYWATAG